jgi:hypothetical protein
MCDKIGDMGVFSIVVERGNIPPVWRGGYKTKLMTCTKLDLCPLYKKIEKHLL